MKRKNLSVLSIFLTILVLASNTSCGVKHKVEGNVKVDPISVQHKVVLDTELLYKAYLDECATLYTVPAEVSKCADDKLNDFVQKFTKVVI